MITVSARRIHNTLCQYFPDLQIKIQDYWHIILPQRFSSHPCRGVVHKTIKWWAAEKPKLLATGYNISCECFLRGNSYSRLGFIVYESLWAVEINTQEPSDKKGENPKHSYNRKTVPQVSPLWRCYAGFIHQRRSYCFHQVFIMTLHSTVGSIYSFTKAEIKLDDSSDILWQCRWATFAKKQFRCTTKQGIHGRKRNDEKILFSVVNVIWIWSANEKSGS